MDSVSKSVMVKGDHFFEASGIRFHYRVGGHGPLLIAHSVGWGMPGQYIWNGMGPHLEKEHTVIYFEPRGNGQTSKPADETLMSSKIMAEDIEHLRTHLNLETIPVLLGHSNGACIVLRYAEQHALRVEKLVLIDAEIHDSPPNDHFQQWAARRKDDPVYGLALVALGGAMQSPPQTDEDFVAMMREILPWYFSDTRHVATLQAHIDDGVVGPCVWAFLRQSKLDRELENRLPHVADGGRVKAKTLIVWGNEDAMCSLAAARAVAEAVPGAKLVLIDDVGHMGWIEKPDVFWAEMDEFLKA
jgi:pimeloyl-ACP methyl ester carboxylesterase